jgi:hypothetical protein
MLSAGEDKRNVPIEGSRLSGFFNNPACGPVRTRYACSVHGASMSEWRAVFPNDHVFDVPDNGRLWLGQLFDKTSYLMLGPYKGTLENYRAECRGEAKSSKHCGGAGR